MKIKYKDKEKIKEKRLERTNMYDLDSHIETTTSVH